MKRISLLLFLCGAFASVSAQETFYKVFRTFQEKYPEYTFSAQLSNYTETDSVAYSTEYQYAIDAPVKNLSPADLDSLLAAFDHELLRVPEGVKYVRNAADSLSFTLVYRQDAPEQKWHVKLNLNANTPFLHEGGRRCLALLTKGAQFVRIRFVDRMEADSFDTRSPLDISALDSMMAEVVAHNPEAEQAEVFYEYSTASRWFVGTDTVIPRTMYQTTDGTPAPTTGLRYKLPASPRNAAIFQRLATQMEACTRQKQYYMFFRIQGNACALQDPDGRMVYHVELTKQGDLYVLRVQNEGGRMNVPFQWKEFARLKDSRLSE